jgi:hypothetical protein
MRLMQVATLLVVSVLFGMMLIIAAFAFSVAQPASARETPFNLAWGHAVKDEASPASASFSRDGMYLAVGTSPASFNFSNGTIYFFEKSGKLLWTFNTDRRPASTSISSDGSLVAAGGYQLSKGAGKSYVNGSLYLLDKKGDLVWNYTTGAEPVWSAILSSDGSYLAASTSTNLLYFDARQGRLLWNYSAAPEEGSLLGISMSPDGRYVSAGATISGPRYPSNGWKEYFFSSNGTLLWNYTSFDESSSGLSIVSSDSRYAATTASVSGYNGYAYFFDNSGKLLWKKQISSPMLSADISSDGSLLATSTNWGLLLMDRQGKLLWNSTEQGESLTTYLVKMSADGDQVLSGAVVKNGTNLSGGMSFQLRDKTGVPSWGYQVAGDISSVDMSPDGSSIVVVSKDVRTHDSKVYFFEKPDLSHSISPSNAGDGSGSDGEQKENSNVSGSMPLLVGVGATIAGIIGFLTLRHRQRIH